MINDSKESAFERATLPSGIEEKIAKVDWDKRDVLIGTFRTPQQFDICYKNRFYYIPKSQISDARLPIHYVALYQTDNKFDGKGQIRYFGEAIRVALVKRGSIKEIPVRRNNSDELYYRITVREWLDITDTNESGKAILPKESGFVSEFTNMFLLEHSEYVQELLIKSEEEFRLYSELKRTAKTADVEGDDSLTRFRSQGCQFVFSDGEIIVIRVEDGKIITKKSISEFGRRPSQIFRQIQHEIGK